MPANEPTDAAEAIDAIEQNDPIEPMENELPMEPMENELPMEPIEQNDPIDPMDRALPSEPTERHELELGALRTSSDGSNSIVESSFTTSTVASVRRFIIRTATMIPSSVHRMTTPRVDVLKRHFILASLRNACAY
jgi:hypothetical protein